MTHNDKQQRPFDAETKKQVLLDTTEMKIKPQPSWVLDLRSHAKEQMNLGYEGLADMLYDVASVIKDILVERERERLNPKRVAKLLDAYQNAVKGIEVTHKKQFYDLETKPRAEPITLLLHGENGEVGGLEPWMVKYTRDPHPDHIPDGMAKSALAASHAIATAIDNILNPEVTDEEDEAYEHRASITPLTDAIDDATLSTEQGGKSDEQ